MTEAIFDSADGTEGGQSSHDADIDASRTVGESDNTSTRDLAGAETGPADSHGADIDAGYDDASSGSASDENGLDFGSRG